MKIMPALNWLVEQKRLGTAALEHRAWVQRRQNGLCMYPEPEISYDYRHIVSRSYLIRLSGFTRTSTSYVIFNIIVYSVF